MRLTLLCLFILSSLSIGQDTSNTIGKSDFNFGHQLGYMYSRMDNAYFKPAGSWSFQTGFLAFHTPEMPLVRNPAWKERTILMVPLYFKIVPCRNIELEAEVTDLFVEFPYKNIHNMGGKSPRFMTKMGLLKEKSMLPAIAATIGVKFSSAKPYTIWDNDHNYDESNGLAGAGTGVADYLLLFTFSKTFDSSVQAHARLGLAPIGSPVEYGRGSGQADEIPYGIAVSRKFTPRWSAQAEVSGMYNGLRSTRLAHYSIARLQLFCHGENSTFTLNLERGLTTASDTWVAGFYETFDFSVKPKCAGSKKEMCCPGAP
jgi:hypothetical protein